MQVSRVAAMGLLFVLATGCGRAPTASSPVAEPATVVAVPAALVMTAGDTAQVVVQANDRSGQAIGGSVFTFRLAAPDLASVTERGLVTANGRTGATELLVSSGARQARVPVQIIAGPAVRLVPGVSFEPVAPAESLPAYSVEATDAFGNPVAGAEVRFEASEGGQVDPPSAITDASGYARTTWSIGSRSGSYQLVASLDPAPPLATTVIVRPGAPDQLLLVDGADQTVAAGNSVPQDLRFQVVDRFGNPVPGVEVTFEVGADAVISAAAAVSGEDGVVSPGTWRLDAVGEHSLIARLGPDGPSVTAKVLATAPAEPS